MLAPFCAKILAHAGRKEFAYKIIHRITNPIPSSEEMENSSAVSSFFLGCIERKQIQAITIWVYRLFQTLLLPVYTQCGH